MVRKDCAQNYIAFAKEEDKHKGEMLAYEM
jgi:hypothetical protein